jgi:glycosyltransferase involved in cell wall biosynthesis
MKIGAFLLSYNRYPEPFTTVLNSVKNQTVKPDEIYIINNNPDEFIDIDSDHITTINCSHNMGCRIRHAIAMTTDCDMCLFLDDDVKLHPKAIENFIKYTKKYPDSVLGYYGRNIIPDHLYSLDVSNFFSKEEREVDIILGMVHFCSKKHLANSFKVEHSVPIISKEDDIMLSLANKMFYNLRNYVIPYDEDSRPIPLPSNEKGISGSPNHLNNRKNIVKQFLEKK